jgi:hypothetical protein
MMLMFVVVVVHLVLAWLFFEVVVYQIGISSQLAGTMPHEAEVNSSNFPFSL